MKHWIFFSLLALFEFHTGFGQTSTDVNNLLTQLFTTQSYNTNIRPQVYQGNATDIFIDFFLYGITGFDEIEQKLTTTAYLEILWIDEGLQWSSASYGGVTNFFVPQINIWLPDIALHNGFKDLDQLGSKFIRVNVYENGYVYWKPFHVFESTCKLDSTYFPFERQVCNIDFIAWSSDGDDLHLVVGDEGVVVDGESSNGQWEMISSRAISFSESGETKVRFMLLIKRKPLFYIINIILPIILLSILNIYTFQIPADIGERMGYSVTVWLSFAVFLTIISASLPRSSDTLPILSLYIIIQLSIGTIGVLVSAWQSRVVQYGDDKPTNRLLRKLALWKRKSSTLCKKKNTVTLVKEHDSIGSEKADKKQDDDGNDAVINWKEAIAALDFFIFWLFLGILLITTLVLFLASAIGGQNAATESDFDQILEV